MKTKRQLTNSRIPIGVMIIAIAITMTQTVVIAQDERPWRKPAGETEVDPPRRRDRPDFGPERLREGRRRGPDHPGAFEGPGGPGGPRRRGAGPPMGRWEELSEVQRQHVERFIEEHFPSLFLELQRLKEHNPQQYARRMMRIGPRMLGLADLARSDPQRGHLAIRERQLHLQIREIARDFRRSSEDQDRRRLRKRVHELCADVFDCQLDRRALEVSELEARLAELKGRLAESKRMREELITQRVKEVLEAPPRRGPPNDQRRDGTDPPLPPEGQ